MGIIAHWGNFTNTEEEEGEVYDLTGNNNTGTLQGETTLNLIGGRGRALNFSGGDASVTVPDSITVSPTTSLSIGAWIYKTDTLRCMVVDKDACYRLWFPLDDNKPAFNVYAGGAWREFVATSLVIPTNQWVFLQAGYDSITNTVQIYCQGSLNCENIAWNYGVVNDNDYVLYLGKYAPGGYLFRGYMGEVIIRDNLIDLATHRIDLKRWLKKRSRSVIEFLELHIGGIAPILITTNDESVTATVYGMTSGTTTTTTTTSTTSSTIDYTTNFVFTARVVYSNRTFALPLQSNGTYDFIVDWGDGVVENITSYNQTEVTHTYPGAGTYQIVISGTINGFSFNNGGDKQKMREVKSWGPLKPGSNGGHFYGCTFFSVTATDTLDLTGVTSMNNMFRNCNYYDGVGVGNCDTSSVTDMSYAFCNAYQFDQNLGNWDFGAVTTLEHMLYNVTLSTVNYDPLLIALDDQFFTGVICTIYNELFDVGESKFSPGAAALARFYLMDDCGWQITDGGEVS